MFEHRLKQLDIV